MRIPPLSIPAFEELGNELGVWVWTMPRDFSHRVAIEHLPGRWMAGVEKDGECLIAGLWTENSEGSIGALASFTGRLSSHMNPSFTEVERTERIWSFLAGQAITMHYMPITITKWR